MEGARTVPRPDLSREWRLRRPPPIRALRQGIPSGDSPAGVMTGVGDSTIFPLAAKRKRFYDLPMKKIHGAFAIQCSPDLRRSRHLRRSRQLHRRLDRLRDAAIVVLGVLLLAPAVAADPAVPPASPPAATLFADADITEGEALIEQHDCAACHIRNVGGDGTAIYKPKGRINTPAFLRGMVEYCNTQLKLQLFPEEVTSISAVLNRDHYKFD